MGGRWRGVKRALSIQRTTNYGLEYIRYPAAEIWSSLPDRMRTITSFKDFKTVIKKWTLVVVIIVALVVVLITIQLHFVEYKWRSKRVQISRGRTYVGHRRQHSKRGSFYEDFRMLLVIVVVKSYNDKLITLNSLLIGQQIAISYYKKGKIGKICRTFSNRYHKFVLC